MSPCPPRTLNGSSSAARTTTDGRARAVPPRARALLRCPGTGTAPTPAPLDAPPPAAPAAPATTPAGAQHCRDAMACMLVVRCRRRVACAVTMARYPSEVKV